MKRYKVIAYLALLLVLGAATTVSAQLINYLPGEPALTEKQQHYYDRAMISHFAQEATFATINFEKFESNRLKLNLPGGLEFDLQREQRSNVPKGRISWIGREEASMGAAHFTFKKNSGLLVAQIQFDDICYVIAPLTEGLHAVIRYDMTLEEGCMTDAKEVEESDPKDNKRFYFNNSDLQNNITESVPGARTTGECNIRVLVSYTDDVDANRADIYSDIVTMINTANTGYINSGQSPGGSLNYSIELATAYEYIYTETGNMQTDLDCIHDVGDGCLDDIHTQRGLWDADQCVLLTANGTGLAKVNTAYNKQFSVTGEGNFFAHTFHHELGHNAECLHGLNQAVQTGSPPYAGYGEPGGCFRTVLAYQDECGTGAGTCPRQNIFSDNDVNQWTCSSTAYTPGTVDQRNQDRLVASRNIIVAHETVGNNVSYGDDYNWGAREAVHFAANNTLSYSSNSNNFEFFNGSYGSFRASDAVTLGEGFWARNGCEFDAYLENCTPLRPTADQPNVVTVEDNVIKAGSALSDFNIFPNPTRDLTNISFSLVENASIRLVLFNMQGQEVDEIANVTDAPAGVHNIEYDVSQYRDGVYFLYLFSDDKKELKRLVIQK